MAKKYADNGIVVLLYYILLVKLHSKIFLAHFFFFFLKNYAGVNVCRLDILNCCYDKSVRIGSSFYFG